MKMIPSGICEEAAARTKRIERWLWAALLVAVGSLICLNTIWIVYFFG